MDKVIKAVRGMNDLLPADTFLWQQVEKQLIAQVERVGYQEIRFPLLENTALFKRSIGEVTDIVEKEMYTFLDRNGDSLTLRPEGTAGCVRAGIENGLLYNQTQRLWYQGPMFRHERPQKGRYRQFYQFGVEMFGFETPDSEAELIGLSAACFAALGVSDDLQLRINSLGSAEAGMAYRSVLIDYFNAHLSELDEDSVRRLSKNPLRILDSKNPAMSLLINNAPQPHEYLDAASNDHFETICAYLTAAKIPYIRDPTLVRGLDYYNRTVFEWVTAAQGAQNTVCAGGRFDGLVGQLGGKPTPAVGFSIGIERLVGLYQTRNESLGRAVDVYCCFSDVSVSVAAFPCIQQLRRVLENTTIMMHCGNANLKNQLKKADKSGATIALMFAEHQQVTVKYLREEKSDITMNYAALDDFLRRQCLSLVSQGMRI